MPPRICDGDTSRKRGFLLAAKPDYGVDAPGVIRNLLLVAAACVLLALFLPPVMHFGQNTFALRSIFWSMAPGFALGGLLMLLYARVGKLRHRDRMLALLPWRGDEAVLDVGTGRGLLLVGAAHRAPSGHLTGIDIWNAEDLTGNALENTRKNLDLEAVAARCTLLSEDARRMTFPPASFDVILSNLCLHNIPEAAGRTEACREIARVLRPGGVAILSDYKNTREYVAALRSAGLTVERRFPNFLTTFPPLRIVIARKPLAATIT